MTEILLPLDLAELSALPSLGKRDARELLRRWRDSLAVAGARELPPTGCLLLWQRHRCPFYSRRQAATGASVLRALLLHLVPDASYGLVCREGPSPDEQPLLSIEVLP